MAVQGGSARYRHALGGVWLWAPHTIPTFTIQDAQGKLHKLLAFPLLLDVLRNMVPLYEGAEDDEQNTMNANNSIVKTVWCQFCATVQQGMIQVTEPTTNNDIAQSFFLSSLHICALNTQNV